MYTLIVLSIIFIMAAGELCDGLYTLIREIIGLREIHALRFRHNDSEIKRNKRRGLMQYIGGRAQKQLKRLIIEAVICCVAGSPFVVCLFSQKQMVTHKNEFYISDNDQKKELYELFPEDDTPDDEEMMEEEYLQYRKLLHYDWMPEYADINDITSETIRQYGLHVLALGQPSQMREDVSMSALSKEEKEKVYGYADIIDAINSGGGKRTREESEQEYQAYWNSYHVRAAGEMSFQAGRAREDYYWNNHEQMQTEEKLQIVAEMMEAFDTFLQHDNKVVKTEWEEREVSVDEIFYRKGKVLYHLAGSMETGMLKLHLLLYANGCFAYINGLDPDEEQAFRGAMDFEETWKAGGYCYTGLVIKMLLPMVISNPQVYEYLVGEGMGACDKAIALCGKRLGISSGSLVFYQEHEIHAFQEELGEDGWMMESGMLLKILQLENDFTRFENYIQDKKEATHD